MIHHLVYASSTPALLHPDEILDILRVSRRNNARSGVTGVLLYSEGNVIQVLEGPRDAVDDAFARVALDPRHSRIQVLLREDKPRRYFEEWSMGFGRMDQPDEVETEDRQILNRLLHRDFDPETLGEPQRAHRLLLTFRQIVERNLAVQA